MLHMKFQFRLEDIARATPHSHPYQYQRNKTGQRNIRSKPRRRCELLHFTGYRPKGVFSGWNEPEDWGLQFRVVIQRALINAKWRMLGLEERLLCWYKRTLLLFLEQLKHSRRPRWTLGCLWGAEKDRAHFVQVSNGSLSKCSFWFRGVVAGSCKPICESWLQPSSIWFHPLIRRWIVWTVNIP